MQLGDCCAWEAENSKLEKEGNRIWDAKKSTFLRYRYVDFQHVLFTLEKKEKQIKMLSKDRC